MKSHSRDDDQINEVEEVERTLREDSQEEEPRDIDVETNAEGEVTARDAWEQGPGQDPMIAAHL